MITITLPEWFAWALALGVGMMVGKALAELLDAVLTRRKLVRLVEAGQIKLSKGADK